MPYRNYGSNETKYIEDMKSKKLGEIMSQVPKITWKVTKDFKFLMCLVHEMVLRLNNQLRGLYVLE